MFNNSVYLYLAVYFISEFNLPGFTPGLSPAVHTSLLKASSSFVSDFIFSSFLSVKPVKLKLNMKKFK